MRTFERHRCGAVSLVRCTGWNWSHGGVQVRAVHRRPAGVGFRGAAPRGDQGRRKHLPVHPQGLRDRLQRQQGGWEVVAAPGEPPAPLPLRASSPCLLTLPALTGPDAVGSTHRQAVTGELQLARWTPGDASACSVPLSIDQSSLVFCWTATVLDRLLDPLCSSWCCMQPEVTPTPCTDHSPHQLLTCKVLHSAIVRSPVMTDLCSPDCTA